MNYIQQLKNTIEETTNNLNEQKEIINNFLKYLGSSKFHNDTTIQVWEVKDLLLTLRNNIS